MKYVLRSVKYLVKLLVLFALILTCMQYTDSSTLDLRSFDTFLVSYLSTWRGWLFSAAVLIWCAVYPKVEFISRHMDYNMAECKILIIKAFGAGGMRLASEQDGKMIFRGQGIWRTIWNLGDEAVTVTQNAAGGFDMEGPRRFVNDAMRRIPAYAEAN